MTARDSVRLFMREMGPGGLSEYRNLEPAIYRQRLVIEGVPAEPIDAQRITGYLSELSVVCGMRLLGKPFTHRSDRFGWAGWAHWEASGVHMYAWEQPSLFASVDVYTCKAFAIDDAVVFTQKALALDPVVAKEF